MRWIPVIAAVTVLLAGCGPSFPTRGPVHWHATVDISVCGQQLDLPRVPAGQGHLGSGLLHTHDDNVIHVEGAVRAPEDITLAKFFQVVGMKPTPTSIGGWGETQFCDDGTGRLRVIVNGEETSAWMGHSVRDGDVVEIGFD